MHSNNTSRGTRAKTEKRGTLSYLVYLANSCLLERHTNTHRGRYTEKNITEVLPDPGRGDSNAITARHHSHSICHCAQHLPILPLNRKAGESGGGGVIYSHPRCLIRQRSWSYRHSALLSDRGTGRKKKKLRMKEGEKGGVRARCYSRWKERKRWRERREPLFLCCALMNVSDGEVLNRTLSRAGGMACFSTSSLCFPRENF